jgi:hypothetical protein
LPPEAETVTGLMGPPVADSLPEFREFEADSVGYEHWTATLAVAEWPDGEVTVSVSPISQLFDAGLTESETPTLPPAGTVAVADPELVPLERAQW